MTISLLRNCAFEGRYIRYLLCCVAGAVAALVALTVHQFPTGDASKATPGAVDLSVPSKRSLLASFKIPVSPPFRRAASGALASRTHRGDDAELLTILRALDLIPSILRAAASDPKHEPSRESSPASFSSPLAGTEPPDFPYLVDYAYSEVPPAEKPADTVLRALKDVPEGTPIEEVQRAARAFGLDVVFMEVVAKIESGFNPKQRTGSYVGIFQLSKYEFDLYGSGDITDARDNTIAAAYKFAVAAILFEIKTHKKATADDLYLIHQQGTQGAAEHVAHPERLAWQSMCATDEGRLKGERWCKRAIWANTLPDVKKAWGSVEALTSAAFVAMWSDRIANFRQKYSVSLSASAEPPK